ncbi:NACHT, LRR and PYD domains-containing protein 3-like [Boleophthalmus pectinirostris]|uniref:NACHT, LRR and PYD domains-containing protein 3-like n=1 Tax=Boleophthalmus pectinirostris TaxID=150288 RepID=UPI00242FD01F|nr:NACHT, LRR and PYD domains-containing protein 3-like [Boleophthalmus pectinirostris]
MDSRREQIEGEAAPGGSAEARRRSSASESRPESMKSDQSKGPPDVRHEPEPSSSLVKPWPWTQHDDRTEQKQVHRTSLTGEELQKVLQEYKLSLSSRCGSVTEGTEGAGSRTPLNMIYTELYITAGLSEEDTARHEERRLEELSKKTVQETSIRCQDIFKALPTEQQGAPQQKEQKKQRSIRAVLTCGVAGAGKTFSVLKFSLDWAQGSENQDVDLVLPLSFRELNLVREESYSLVELIQLFHPALEPQTLTAQTLSVSKLLFIFDGLDESRLSLDFHCEFISEVTQRSEVSVLLVNLIKGKLLPTALIWITSRPAAANQIPAQCVHRVTEVRGFITDHQKEQYFRKRFTDEEQCKTVLSHIRTSRSLHNMCQIPVFCWITATVLDHMLRTNQSGALPQTLSDMYAHFLLVQTYRKSKNTGESSGPELNTDDCELLLKLGRLAFEHLQKGNFMFYQEDLEQVGLDLTEDSVYSGLCTEIFKRESVLFNKSIYCFVHLSVQEFMAALYLLHCFGSDPQVVQRFLGKKMIKLSASEFLKRSLVKSMKSSNGRLDLFVRFLHGLSLDSNQKLLGRLLSPVNQSEIPKVIENLKEMSSEKVSPDQSINIFHCLMEMKDQSFLQQIQDLLKSRGASQEELSEFQCSALAYVLQMSEQVLEELDLQKYNTSVCGRQRLIPAVRSCRKARLVECGLSKTHCEVVASALQSSSNHLKELDLSGNDLSVSAVVTLCAGLQSRHCELSSLRLSRCSLTYSCCLPLDEALWINPSHLRVLDLSENLELTDLGVEILCDFLWNPLCQLETLRLSRCSLTYSCCWPLDEALWINPSHLRVLDLSENLELTDRGVEFLLRFLWNPLCQLETLSLRSCGVSDLSCRYLASALRLRPSLPLRHLDLRGNTVTSAGLQELRERVDQDQVISCMSSGHDKNNK